MTAQPTTPTNTPTAGTRSRRDVLCGLMVAIVAPGALVAACSDSGSGTGSDAGSDTGSPDGGNQGGGQTGGGQAGGGQTLTALDDIPDGGGLIVDGADGKPVVVVRTGTEVKAYNAACTHMGTTVDAPQDGVATCPNHGSKFAMSDGSVENGPATQPLATIAVKVEGDNVVLA